MTNDTPSVPTVIQRSATTAMTGTPTAQDMAKVIAYINEQVIGHLKNAHGLTDEQLLNPSKELFEKTTEECGLAYLWSQMQGVLLGFYQQLTILELVNADPLPGDGQGPQPKRLTGPRIFGKLGEA